MLINGICLQPFERIERIEPLEHFIDTNASKRDFFYTKSRRHKVFYKTKMLINGICLQPFERIERIEPLEHFIDTNASKRDFVYTKSRRRKDTKFFYKTKMLINGICLQPFERIERIEPLEHFIDMNARKRDFFDTKALMGKNNSPYFLIPFFVASFFSAHGFNRG